MKKNVIGSARVYNNFSVINCSIQERVSFNANMRAAIDNLQIEHILQFILEYILAINHMFADIVKNNLLQEVT